MVDVSLVSDAVNLSGVANGRGGSAGKLVLSLFFMFLVWVILTVIVMLVMAQKGNKRGRIVVVFVVSSVILLGLLLLAYFKIDWFVGMLNIGGM